MSVGYPDGQRVQNWDGPLFWNQQASGQSGSLGSPVTNVSRYGYLAGFVDVQSGMAQLAVTWSMDEAQTVVVGTRTINLFQNIQNGAQLRLPNLGPWVQVAILPLGGAIYNVNVQVFPTNRTHPLELIPEKPVQMLVLNAALAANSEADFYPVDYYSGPIAVNVIAGQAFVFRLEYLNDDGTWWATYVTASVTGQQNLAMLAPAGAWRCGVLNNTATATTCTLRVWQSGTGST